MWSIIHIEVSKDDEKPMWAYKHLWSSMKWRMVNMRHLFAVCILAWKFFVRVCVDVRVLPANVAITGPADVALIEVEGITRCLLEPRLNHNTCMYCIWTSHHTADASISLHNTLCVDIAGVALTVPTQPGSESSRINRIRSRILRSRGLLAATCRVSSEPRLTLSTVEWTLKVACLIY